MNEYDSETCVTAGELRASGIGIEHHIPDCAWIPRSSIMVEMGEVDFDPEEGMMQVQMIHTFTAPFSHYTVELKFRFAPKCPECGSENTNPCYGGAPVFICADCEHEWNK